MYLQSFPSIQLANPFSEQEMTNRLNRIKLFWLPLFQEAAEATGLPLALLVAKSCIESGGQQKTANHTYVGLMQIGKNTIVDCLNYLQGTMYADGKKWAAPKAIVNKVLPLISKYYPNYRFGKSIHKETAFALAKSSSMKGAAFNILMGAVYLHFLCHHPKFIEGETLRLDKVMSAYNTGPNHTFYKSATTDTAQLVQVINRSALSDGKKLETSRHILKFCGVGGAFDLLFNKKFPLH